MKRDIEKARAFQRRRNRPLKRGPGPERKTAMPKQNRERQAKQKPVQFGSQAELCRGLPCSATFPELYTDEMLALEYYTSARRVSAPHHSPTVARGGLDKDTSPVSDRVHERIHTAGEAAVEREMGLKRGHFRRVAALLHHELRGNR
jgi:hypothetical protein